MSFVRAEVTEIITSWVGLDLPEELATWVFSVTTQFKDLCQQYDYLEIEVDLVDGLWYSLTRVADRLGVCMSVALELDKKIEEQLA